MSAITVEPNTNIQIDTAVYTINSGTYLGTTVLGISHEPANPSCDTYVGPVVKFGGQITVITSCFCLHRHFDRIPLFCYKSSNATRPVSGASSKELVFLPALDKQICVRITESESWIQNIPWYQLVPVECWSEGNPVPRCVRDDDALQCHVGRHVEEGNSVTFHLHQHT